MTHIRIPWPGSPMASDLIGLAGVAGVVLGVGMLAGVAWALIGAGTIAVALAVIAQSNEAQQAQQRSAAAILNTRSQANANPPVGVATAGRS